MVQNYGGPHGNIVINRFFVWYKGFQIIGYFSKEIILIKMFKALVRSRYMLSFRDSVIYFSRETNREMIND